MDPMPKDAKLKRITVEFDDGSPAIELLPADADVLDGEISKTTPTISSVIDESNEISRRPGPATYVMVSAVFTRRK